MTPTPVPSYELPDLGEAPQNWQEAFLANRQLILTLHAQNAANFAEGIGFARWAARFSSVCLVILSGIFAVLTIKGGG